MAHGVELSQTGELWIWCVLESFGYVCLGVGLGWVNLVLAMSHQVNFCKLTFNSFCVEIPCKICYKNLGSGVLRHLSWRESTILNAVAGHGGSLVPPAKMVEA